MFGNWVPPMNIDYPDFNWEFYWLILVYERIELSKLSRPYIESMTLNTGLFLPKSIPNSFYRHPFRPEFIFFADVPVTFTSWSLLADMLI